MSVRCGNKTHDKDFAPHHHETVAMVKLCFAREGGVRSVEEQADEDEQYANYLAEGDPDGDYERHLENSGWQEAALQDQMEAQAGVVSFEDAMREAEERMTAKAVTSIQTLTPAEVFAAKPLLDGVYTIGADQGSSSDHRTFCLRTQSSKDDFMPGEQIIGYLNGPDNEHDYASFATVTNGRLKVWKRFRDNVALVRDAEILLSDPDGALQAAYCYRCHALLSVPESILSGFGPTCAKKGI